MTAAGNPLVVAKRLLHRQSSQYTTYLLTSYQWQCRCSQAPALQDVASAGQCSMYGICLGALSTDPNVAPTITLLTTAAAPVTTSIKLGYSYLACASGQQPATGAECELGATALDSQNGNLTSQVLVCAPAACTSVACIASEFAGFMIRFSGCSAST